MDAMFEPLTPAEADTAATSSKRATKVPIVPVPDDAPAMSFKHPKLGAPTRSWAYRDAEGRIVGYVVRWDTVDADGRPAKTILPISYCDIGKGRRAWRSAGMPEPRPLFRLPEILASPEKPVLVCEGEKTCDAAAVLFPDMVVTTPAHGARSPHKTDFGPCAGRVVVIATDYDAPAESDTDAAVQRQRPGRAFGDAVCRLVREAGAAKVLHLHPDRLAAWLWRDGERVRRESPIEDGWDLADALDEGWTAGRITGLASDPAFLPPYATAAKIAESLSVLKRGSAGADHSDGEKDYTGPRFRCDAAGVWKLVERTEGGETVLDWRWFCSVLEIAAETRNIDGRDWGRLLRVVDRDGIAKEWAMPMELLAGDGTDYRRELLSLGLELAPGRFAREALHEYISTEKPKAKARCVDRTGWHGRSFVTFAGAIGPGDGERITFQTNGAPEHAFRRRGTLLDWQDAVAKYAVGNSRLVLALSAAFAAPLVGPALSESGGFHFRGPSSTGKSTALVVAGSAWGGGGVGGFLRSWRATANGTEGIAARHCDALLCLDEMGQAGAGEVGQIAYMLANGVGKTRSDRLGHARRATEWRLLFLSSGEVSLADKIAEDGRGRRPAAGQAVRIVDIPADAGAGMGLFETLHGFASPDALARHLKDAAADRYGTAAPAFLGSIVRDLDGLVATVKTTVDAFVEDVCPAGADGQVRRVAARFGLAAAGGECAVALGVLPWDEGEPISGARRCFLDWLAGRGGCGSAEEMEIVAHVRHFIIAHGASRFEPIPGPGNRDRFDEADGFRIQNRVGYRRLLPDGTAEYIVPPVNWKRDLCQGFDHAFVTRVLAKRGLLLRGGDGKPQVKNRLPGAGDSVRCYVIPGARLHGEADVAEEDA